MCKMKRMIAMVLAVVLVCGLTSCDVLDDLGITGREFELGDIDGNTWENEFIGLGCTLDSDWTFYTDAQMRELNGIGANVSEDEMEAILAKEETFFDMFAMHSNQTDSINVVLGKGKKSELANLDVAESLEETFATLKEDYEELGYTDLAYELVTVEVVGEMCDAMIITGQIQDASLHQLLTIKKCERYVASITITTLREDHTEALLDCFYAVAYED